MLHYFLQDIFQKPNKFIAGGLDVIWRVKNKKKSKFDYKILILEKYGWNVNIFVKKRMIRHYTE